jgi:hypothetical protein
MCLSPPRSAPQNYSQAPAFDFNASPGNVSSGNELSGTDNSAQVSALAANTTRDTSAEQAALQASQRQDQILKGQSAIDTAFQPYDDNFYANYGKTYENYFDPQIDNQFLKAQQQQTYDLARRGVTDSTPAITAADKLNQAYGQQRQQVGSDAINAVNTLKNNVQSQKNSLYSLNTSAADPTLAASHAADAVGTLPTLPKYSVLGDLFGGLVNSGASYVAGQNQALPKGYNAQLTAGLPTGLGSGRIVN